MKQFIFKLKNLAFRRHAYKKYKQLLLNDSLSVEEIQVVNWEKRKRIIKHAYENIPFYKNWYSKHGFHPNQLKSQKDWALIPVITKEIIRENFNEMMFSDIDEKRHIISSTGGTSGTPLKVLHDKNNFNDVNSWRVMKWWNLPISPNIAFVFRKTRSSKISVLLNRIMWFPTKRVFLDASSVNDIKIEAFINKIINKNVIILQGYTGALNEVANYVIKNKISVPSVRSIWCTSSPLTNIIRKNLEKAFNAEVYDQYGSGEVYWIATECDQHEGLHIHSDIRHVDIVDNEDKPVENGVLGNVLITDLENYLFPIIKYKNGDLSMISKVDCSCKKPYPLLTKIYGRITDLIKLPNGGFIAGDYFTTIFDDYPDDVRTFQIHQKEDFSIDINIAFKNNINNDIINNVKELITNKTKDLVILRVNILKEIKNNLAGKNRFVISDIK